MKKNIIFIASIYPHNVLTSIMKEGSHIDFAANTFQTGLIEGLQNLYDDIKIITSPVTSTYPKSKKIIYGKQKYSWDVSNKSISVTFTGFINLPFIKLLSEFFRIRHALKKQLIGNDTIYIYALHSPFLLAVYSLKKHISKVCVIVPDLPDYMSHNKGKLRQFMKRINKCIINKCLSKFSYYVLFSRYMEQKLSLKGKKWITVEGIYSQSVLPKCKKESKKIILYSGIISSQYGVFDLIEAFHNIKGSDYELWLCGSCNYEMDKLKLFTNLDPRIKYLGLLQKSEVRILQLKATLLVNPRHSNEEFTKYSFPSKTMEYLASGTTTLMCKLPAIPEEYNDYLFFFEDESIEGYKKRIIEICNMDQEALRIKGEKAKMFIIKEKNNYAQAKHIYDMVEEKQLH